MDIFSAIALGILWAGMIISVISLFIMQLKIYNVLLQIRDTEEWCWLKKMKYHEQSASNPRL
jgi:hypothetical protein